MRQRILKKLFAVSICLSLFSSAFAARFNNSISGQIIDAATNEPVYYANVFLANTTIGATSNADGHYILKNIPPGNYSLVVSFIGYELETKNIRVASNVRAISNFALTPTVLEMEAVQVAESRDRTWRKLFQAFRDEFLGYTENAKACEFLNPEVMRLVKDDAGNVVGKTLQPLEMVHHNFGYKVSIIVRSFESTDKEVSYTVLPQYEELSPQSEEQAEMWEENRQKAFYGSYRHFFYALFLGQLKEAGFSAELVDQPRRFRAPKASFTSESARGVLYSDTEFDLIKRLHFHDYLRVRYLENWTKISFLTMPFDTMQVDVAGNTLSDMKIIRSGYWGRRRFAEELPLNYVPRQRRY